MDTSSVTIENGTFNSQYPLRAFGTSNITINGGDFVGSYGGITLVENSNLIINNGTFFSEPNSALHLAGNSNVKINKGIFNSNRTDYRYDGVLQNSGAGTLTIGNIGDSNENIIINNNNNNKICGIHMENGANVIVNSGTIVGYTGINLYSNNVKLYLNGGTISGTGGTVEGDSGWAIGFTDGVTQSNVYLKRLSNINLSGRGRTGNNAIRYTQYITEVD